MTLLEHELFGAVWTQAWQIAAAAWVVGFVTRRFCARRPHLAYMLWMLVIVKCLTPPVWSSPVGLFSLVQLRVDEGTSPPSAPNAAASGLVAPASSISAGRILGKRPAGGNAGSGSLEAPHGHRNWRWWASTLGVSLWAAGAMLLGGATAAGWIRCQRIVARSRNRADALLTRRVDELARRLGIRRSVEVIVSDAPVGPAVFGIVRPKLILPRSLVAERRLEQLEPVIAHELVHVRRRDAVLMLIELAAKVAWWFHPAVWWAGQQISRQRERCCDSETIAGLGYRPARYARCLLDVLEHKQAWRTVLVVPGMRPVEVTSRRLEEIMSRASAFRTRPPRSCWAAVVVAALLVLPGSPLVIQSAADPSDEISAARIREKLDELEDGAWQAGLSDEETKAVLKLAERLQCNEKLILSLRAKGKLSEVEARAIDKLVKEFGNPLEEDLAELREAAQRAGLSDQERKAAEALAVREAFDKDAIVALYEAGKLSDVERRALEKLFEEFGRPYADELSELTKLAAAAGLSEAETQTLKQGFVRAGCDVKKVVEWKRSGSLSKEEAAALKKLEAHLGKLEYYIDNPRDEDVPVLVRLAKVAGMNEAETDAMMALFQRADYDEWTLLDWKRAGKLSDTETAAMAKLEGLLGKLEDFVQDSRKEAIGELLELAIRSGCSIDQTRALLKLGCLVNFDPEVVLRLKKAGRLTDVEAAAVEKIENHLER